MLNDSRYIRQTVRHCVVRSDIFLMNELQDIVC
jgi:hypothetical protein